MFSIRHDLTHTDGQMDRQTDRQTDTQADRQTDRRTDRHKDNTDTQTDSHGQTHDSIPPLPRPSQMLAAHSTDLMWQDAVQRDVAQCRGAVVQEGGVQWPEHAH